MHDLFSFTTSYNSDSFTGIKQRQLLILLILLLLTRSKHSCHKHLEIETSVELKDIALSFFQSISTLRTQGMLGGKAELLAVLAMVYYAEVEHRKIEAESSTKPFVLLFSGHSGNP